MFRALADPTRRFLLDRLFARDGRTLTELESELEMTRFGVMKHLKVLQEAGLVVARRSGGRSSTSAVVVHDELEGALTTAESVSGNG